jgi:hypothetical protein
MSRHHLHLLLELLPPLLAKPAEHLQLLLSLLPQVLIQLVEVVDEDLVLQDVYVGV